MLMIKVQLDGTEVTQILDIVDSDDKLASIEQEYQRNLVSNSVDDSIIDAINSKSNEERTESDLNKLALRQRIENNRDDELKDFYDNYLIFVPDHNSNITSDEFDEPFTYYEKGEDNKIYQRWSVEKNNTSRIKERIQSLKEDLLSTDYMIIKAYEAKIALSDAPYTTDELETIIQRRQATRNRINELEELLK
jgi:hypothetical protein